MPDYKQGKIYKIVSDKCDVVYYGSTTLTLMERWKIHKSKFNAWKKGKRDKYACFKYFDEYGIDNFRIELLEDYPCDNDEQLRMKEDEYIHENECVNERRAYATYEDTLAKTRQYHQDNKIERNKIRVKKLLERVTCECGRELSRGALTLHRKTAYHLSRI